MFIQLSTVAQNTKTNDRNTTKLPADTLVASRDSLSNDSIVTDSLSKRVRISKNAIKSDVKYTAKDSMTFDLTAKTVKMYNTAQVNYEKIELKSAHISYGFASNLVFATSMKDTAGGDYGKPQFKDGEQAYDSDTLRYNFKTKKGAIKGVYTKMNNDGHIYGRLVKKDSNDVLWIKDGSFCPCEDKDAKTRIKVGRLKVIPQDKIITGWGYLSVGKIPTPLAFPFGFFPNQQKQSSGILIPAYGDNATLGFFLINGGYYQPIGEKLDLAVTGDIYSKGSFGFKTVSNYRSNYRNSGGVSLTYNVVKNSYKEFSDYTESRNFFVRWNHVQDPKARPNTTFSANVNVGSGKAFRNNFNSSVNDYISNSFNSGINYGKAWEGKPYTLSVSALHSQNTQSKSFSVTLPNAAFNLQRVFLPLDFLKPANDPTEKWFERIGFNFSSNFSNQLNTFDTLISFNNARNLAKDFRNGFNNTASLSTSFKALHMSINPSINYNEKWYFDRKLQYYNPPTGASGEVREYGFYRLHDYGARLNFTTQLFGMFTAKKGKVAAIRHIMTPSVALYYNPKFDYSITDNVGDSAKSVTYSPYNNNVFGSTGLAESGGLDFDLTNNLEMKVRTPRDTAELVKKIKLIDSYSIRSRYDIVKDSLNWSDINMAARTVLFQKVNLTYNGNFSAYNYDAVTGGDINQSLVNGTGKLLRMKSTQFNVSMSFGKISDQAIKDLKKRDKFRITDILPVGIPITTSINYTINLTRNYGAGKDTLITTQSLSAIGELQLLRRLKVGYNTGYDFTLKKLTPTFLNIYFDMNCWELVASYVPFGFRKSYTVRLNMKSAILKDVKLERRRNLSENNLIF